jgi:hypothetical protein
VISKLPGFLLELLNLNLLALEGGILLTVAVGFFVP